MHARGNRTFICSVLFLDIAGYSEKPVAEQIRLKERFNALVGDALQGVAAADRIILDTGDGAAVSFIGDPEDALTVAGRLRDTLQSQADESLPLQVRLGINLGPVKLVRDINGQPNIIGDGINVAQRIMTFAEPGQVLVSRSYFEVVSRISEGYASLFEYRGVRTDKHVRAHEVYMLTAGPNSALPWAQVPEGGHEDVLEFRAQRAAETEAESAPRRSRRLLVGLPLAAAVIVGAALVVREYRAAPRQAPVAAAPAVAPSAPQAPPDPQPAGIPPPASSPAPELPAAATPVPAPERRAQASPAAEKPGTIEFAITPWGEIYVDGKLKGVSPPVQKLEVAPGAHEIEIRNSDLPTHRRTVAVEPGEVVKIRHKFR
ncbi:MAG: adenylate/guanylate cyclase domain-containing protein [Pseudomonadota bacterium]